MAKYRQRDSGNWTISSTVMGWGVTGIAILLVGFLLVGIYVGYGMGIEEGKKQVRQELKKSGENSGNVSDRIAQIIDDKKQSDNQRTQSNGSGQPSPDSSDTDQKEGAFTEEDLGFLTEGAETESEQQSDATRTADQRPDKKADLPTDGSSSEKDQGTTGDNGNESPYDTGESTEVQSGGQMAESGDKAKTAGSTSPYGTSQRDTSELETFYTIQTVSFKERKYADRAAKRLRDQGHSVMINEATVNNTDYFRVRVGVFPTRSKAEEYASGMKERGEIEDYWISKVTRE